MAEIRHKALAGILEHSNGGSMPQKRSSKEKYPKFSVKMYSI